MDRLFLFYRISRKIASSDPATWQGTTPWRDEVLEGKYALKAMGYDFDRVAMKVTEVMGMTAEQVTAF